MCSDCSDYVSVCGVTPKPSAVEKLKKALHAERHPQDVYYEEDARTDSKVLDLMAALKNSLAPQTTDKYVAEVAFELEHQTRRADDAVLALSSVTGCLKRVAIAVGADHTDLTDVSAKVDALVHRSRPRLAEVLAVLYTAGVRSHITEQIKRLYE